MTHQIQSARVTRAHALSVAVAAALAGFSNGASAAFFQVHESSAAGLGTAYAGGAAIAEDASTVWYNSAGMTRLPGQQFVAGLSHIKPSFQYKEASGNLTPALGGGAISGGNGGEAGESALVPNLFYTRQLNERLFMGVGLNAPFGLATEYDADWVGRYHGIRSDLRIINLNGALAYKTSEQFSIGGGINYQRLEAELTQAIDYGSLCTFAFVASGGLVGGSCAAPGAVDGAARMEGDDDAWGYNLGALWQPTVSTRVGLAYRSKMKYNIEGTFDATAPSADAAASGALAAGIVDSGAKADVTLPATFSLSVHQRLTPQWAIMGDVTRTFWSDLPEFRVQFDSTQSDAVTTLDLKDVNRYAAGLSFSPGGAWTYRAGIALDKTPTPNASVRTPRLPDADRKWLALGAGYQRSQSLTFDIGYVYLTTSKVDTNKQAGTDPAGENFLRGSFVGGSEGKSQILSAQVNWKF